MTCGWNASLRLRFERDGARTILAERCHRGPLVVQKPLYPEGADLCQCIVVHPPAGIAGGDRLSLEVDVEASAIAQLTTPGAAKWYRCESAPASQHVLLRVASGGLLEWLPQGAIVYDGARASSSIRIELARDAALVAFDAVCLGRIASGERFQSGHWRQRLEIVRDGALIWSERAALQPSASDFLASPVGLNGRAVFGTFVATSADGHGNTLDALRALTPIDGEGAVTRLPHLIVGRYRGDSLQGASAYFAALWSVLRPALVNRAARLPRIWST